MNEKKDDTSPIETASHISIVLGSAVRLTAAAEYALMFEKGISPDLFVKHLFFDFQNHLDSGISSVLGIRTENFYGVDSFVEAAIPTNRKALEKAEREGRAWPMSDGWLKDPGTILDNIGASGRPRLGLTITLLNSRELSEKLCRIIRDETSHIRDSKLVTDDINTDTKRARLTFIVQLSTVGAMGSGSALWFLGEEGIAACASQCGIEANIILQLFCRGNLQIHDMEQAVLNEYIIAKHVQVLSSRAYVSPTTGIIDPVHYDALFLPSNQNCNGNMPSPEQLFIHQGHCNYFLYHTPAGTKMRHRLTDILGFKYGEDGDPKIGHTMGCASIGRDRKRVLGFYKCRGAAIFARSFLAKSNQTNIQQQVLSLARQNGIVETEYENQITATVLKPNESQENVIERVKASFIDRVSNTKSLERTKLIQDALESIQNSEIPSIYEPMMRAWAHKKFELARNDIDRHLQQTMRTSHGLQSAQLCFAYLKGIVAKSGEQIADKQAEIYEYLRPNEQIFAEGYEQTETLYKRNRFFRFFHSSLIATLISSLEQTAPIILDYKLQIAACNIAMRDFLTPLADYIDRKLAWLSLTGQKLQQIAQLCENKANSIATASTIFHVPNGIELTDKNYLEKGFNEQLSKYDGAQQLSIRIREMFLNEHGTLAYLAEAPLEEAMETFESVCESIFRPEIDNTDVISEFKRLYTNKNKQRRIIAQLIRQSEGSFLTLGEVDEPVPWLKAANIPSAQCAEWARETLMAADTKSGKWEIAVDSSDPDRFTIYQLRGNISLTTHLERMGVPDNEEGWVKVIDRAPDPGSSIIVPPNPNLRQFRRVLAKSIVNGQLTFNDNSGFVLSSSSGKDLALGKTFQSVNESLRPKWSELVFIESSFNRNLVIAEEQIVEKLHKILSELESDRTADERLRLIDTVAIYECLKQSELLLPRIRRMRSARTKRFIQ